MSLTWDNKCNRCGKSFVSWYSEEICSNCWTDSDTKKRREYEDNIKRADDALVKKAELENVWKVRAEAAERKLSKLPKWFIKFL